MSKQKKPSTKSVVPAKTVQLIPAPAVLLEDLRALILQTREGLARSVNSALVLLYWQMGYRIRIDILKHKRATYGEQVISTLANSLAAEFGPGFSRPNLFRMLRFAEVFADRDIVSTLSRQLSWSHFIEIIPLKNDLQRDFYAEMCRVERWSVRTLHAKIQGMMFERTALSRKPKQLARQELETLREADQMTPDMVFRDPYLLDFLALTDSYSEKDLEAAILREIQRFILELGSDFAFLARQKRIVIGSEDYYLDLLFYHRRLRRLIAVDLKIGKFTAADKGQMELYLRWLERHEQRAGEEAPLGLILCADKDDEQIELLQLDRSGIRVASYLTDLPPRPLLQKKLHDSVQMARAQLESRPAAGE